MRIGFQLPACAALLATAAAGIALARTRPSAPASRPCGATRPAAPLYPSVALVDACRERARAIGEKLDEAFKVVVRPPFVVAGNMPSDRLRETTNRSVVQPAQAAQGPADQARFLRAAAGHQLRAGEILRDVHAAPRTVEEVLRLFPQSSRRPGRRREGRGLLKKFYVYFRNHHAGRGADAKAGGQSTRARHAIGIDTHTRLRDGNMFGSLLLGYCSWIVCLERADATIASLMRTSHTASSGPLWH